MMQRENLQQMRGARFGRRHPLLFCSAGAIALMLFALGCARQAPPPGGLEDKIPPLVQGIWPAPQATEVTADAVIVAEFTKWMNERVAPGVALFSPPLRKSAQVEMRARRLTVTPREPLDPQTTYTVTFQNALTDLRGNRLPAPFQITFSTGAWIDSISYSGVVTDAMGSVPQGTIAGLWPLDSAMRDKFSWLRHSALKNDPNTTEVANDSLDLTREPPLYRASPDSTGQFSFSGVAAGRYRIAAFVDGNGNMRIDPATEWSALGDRDLALESTSDPSGNTKEPPALLTLSPIDTGAVRLLGAEQLPHQQLLLTFNRPLHQKSAEKPSSYTIQAIDASTGDKSDSLAPPVIRALYFLPPNSQPVLWIEGAVTDRAYDIRVTDLIDSFGVALDSVEQKVRFTWNSMPGDTLPVTIAEVLPTHGSIELSPEEKIELRFNAPALEGEWISRVRLASTAETLAVAGEWVSPDRLRILPPQPLHPGTEFSLLLMMSDTLIERAGVNSESGSANDTTVQTSWKILSSFKIWEPMKLGSAKVCLPPNTQLRLSIRRLETKERRQEQRPNREGCALFDPLPEGKYAVESYIDLNDNNRRDLGILLPWSPAERNVRWNDTLIVERGQQQLYDQRTTKVEKIE